MNKIVIFASGSGSNAEKIIQHFADNPNSKVVLVLSNNPNAKVLERAERLNVRAAVFDRTGLNDGEVLGLLQEVQAYLIVLAGFLWKFPESIIKEYPNKVINIHPALLPKYGGKGMYGMYVHQAVLEQHEKVTGITIHYVNEHYDEGGIIFQQEVNIEDCTSAEAIAEKIHELEHRHFPEVIEQLLKQ